MGFAFRGLAGWGAPPGHHGAWPSQTNPPEVPLTAGAGPVPCHGHGL